MKTSIARPFAILLLIFVRVQSTWATCGGGGGGGGGGMSGGGSGGGGGTAPQVYHVPWAAWSSKDAPTVSGLVLYWFPASQDELNKSSLRTSRALSLYAAQCVTMKVADAAQPATQNVLGDAKPPVAVLATPDGSVINKAEGKNNFLKVEQVEKLVESELKQRETAVDTQLKEAKEKEKAGDKDAAIKLYQSVAGEKCMFPKKAKDAAKELKKLGVAEIAGATDDQLFSIPVFEKRQSALIERTMQRGLVAENNARYLTAEKLYRQAHLMDPADPRRCVISANSIATTSAIGTKRARPSTPFSTCRPIRFRAPWRCTVLGKITIHEGEFKKGLGLMEQSVAEYPTGPRLSQPGRLLEF